MKPMTQLIIAAFAAATLIPAAAMAQATDTKNQGYLVDNHGGSIVMSGTGLCWRDSDWTPARSTEPCDFSIKPVAAAAPVMSPVVIATAPEQAMAKPLAQKFSFAGDALFAFDLAELKPEGRAMLDGLVTQLDGAHYETIVATGHTDRFGSNAYNHKLSERRAQAVKAYLVSRNVKASTIDAEGKGETQPITKAEDCKGAQSARTVACLQPDRRVDVEMIGTKTVVGSL
ncbi:MAG TPA: OmpA family protein [Noviherbaspirillum sp.]|uniref:OmpA family protein n=1 Tax=Noviherbaspirillum sp. TaxID=1926288 RepID=UPI002DDD1412|nr:OmpA family protein [Noviherbaspirillum sp.]HEV2609953.1 OmpA family protein [Noviherbaspirillum sp.]